MFDRSFTICCLCTATEPFLWKNVFLSRMRLILHLHQMDKAGFTHHSEEYTVLGLI